MSIASASLCTSFPVKSVPIMDSFDSSHSGWPSCFRRFGDLLVSKNEMAFGPSPYSPFVVRPQHHLLQGFRLDSALVLFCDFLMPQNAQRACPKRHNSGSSLPGSVRPIASGGTSSPLNLATKPRSSPTLWMARRMQDANADARKPPRGRPNRRGSNERPECLFLENSKRSGTSHRQLCLLAVFAATCRGLPDAMRNDSGNFL